MRVHGCVLMCKCVYLCVCVCVCVCVCECAVDVGRSDRGTQKDYLSLVNDIGKRANSCIANKQSNKQTNRQINKQNNKQTDKQTKRHDDGISVGETTFGLLAFLTKQTLFLLQPVNQNWSKLSIFHLSISAAMKSRRKVDENENCEKTILWNTNIKNFVIFKLLKFVTDTFFKGHWPIPLKLTFTKNRWIPRMQRVMIHRNWTWRPTRRVRLISW